MIIEEEAKSESKAAPSSPIGRPSEDQIYLSRKLFDDEDEVVAAKQRLSPAALQKLNGEFGTRLVSDALRQLRGFPPPQPILNPYAYVYAMCARALEEWTA